MRPFTNRGLRRRRPPRTRTMSALLNSSPLPSLPTDTGAGYMSLSTRPFAWSLPLEEGLAVLEPARIDHSARDQGAIRADRDERHRATAMTLDHAGPDVCAGAPGSR